MFFHHELQKIRKDAGPGMLTPEKHCRAWRIPVSHPVRTGPRLHERSSEPPRKIQSSRDVPQLLHSFFWEQEFFLLQRRDVQDSAGVHDGNRTLFKKALTPGQRKKLYAIANTVVPEKIIEVLFEFHLILFK